MDQFVARCHPAITAILNGFDPLVFRGTLLPLVMERGMHTLLARVRVRLLDFKQYALATSEGVKAAALHEAVAQRRPVRYLQSTTCARCYAGRWRDDRRRGRRAHP